MTKLNYISIVLAGIMMSCGDDVSTTAKTSNAKKYLVSADSVSTASLADLKSVAQMAGQSSITSLVKYGVTTYKIVYETTYKGSPIKASGLLYIPEGVPANAPFVSLQHGTTFVKEDAPSTSGKFTGMEYFAAAGYIAIMPDYIGYGESSEIFHPYYDKKHSALTVIDMIKAVKEWCTSENISSNGQLFMAGYSEGGYVTLAAAQELEQNETHNLKVTAVAAGAGGYDLEGMLQSVTSTSYYSYPSYLAFVLMAYNVTNDWNKPLNYFFQDKYATALSTYMNGEYDGWQINSRLTSDVKALLNPSFYNRLKENGGEAELKEALQTNSVDGWRSDIPIQLYHGTRDEIIPYHNSEATLENFKNAGSKDVTLTLIQGGTHGSSFIPMLQKFVPWFESMRE